MKAFNFSGFGNFSTNFGWDNGLRYSINSEEECQATTPGVVVEFSNTHGGSRNVDGYVIASTKIEAETLLNSWIEEQYPEREW